jgi:serine/threonine protein phosphatase PrpC
MKTHRFTSTARKGMGRLALSMLGGLLLVLSLLLPPVAYAAATHAATPSARSAPSLSSTAILDQAGVSVLRLSITYTTKQNTPVTCTALGTLIKSWPATSASEQNNWVVTDGSLLSLTGGTCSPNSSLTRLQLLANNLYTNTTTSLTLLHTLLCARNACHDQQGTNVGPAEALSQTPQGGGILFSFHTDSLDMQPFLDTGTGTPSSGMGIELVTQSPPATWPQTPQRSVVEASTLLTPIFPPSAPGGMPVPTASLPKPEPGMPYIDSQGLFVGMHVSSSSTSFTVTDLLKLEQQAPVTQQAHGTNTLKQQWDAGITAFFQGDYPQAQQHLNVIQDPTHVNNPNFQAAKNFAQQAAAKSQQTGTPTPTTTGGSGRQNSSGSSGSFLGIPISLILLVGLVAGLVFLVLLLVLVSLLFGRRRALRKKDKEELVRFKEDEAAARRNAPLEARRIAGESRQNAQTGQPDYAQPYDMLPSQPLPPAAPILRGQPDQQPHIQQPGQDYDAPDALDTPTVPINRRNGHGESASPAEHQVVRELRNVSLAVGSVSNVGIKRQHKPNEDSLFAVQGARTHNSQPQQFGLFVIADGMGGHTNGQEASRTAIQTMIDFMLPRISVADSAMDNQAYIKLLEDGVQHANYAVHQRNIQDNADMGTTMTTALVIGSMAYIANVGDSRTYLYRQSTGLKKVTRDHSVVANLVDVGVIQPDDIYTHPKRNQIYRSLGEKPVVEVDSFSVELQAGDKLLLCSDGLWDMVRDPDIQRIIASTDASPSKTSEELIQAALNGGGEDNVSVIVVSITGVDGHTGLTGIHFLSKPDTVTVPDLPAM